MSSKHPERRFRDILDNISRIESYTHGLDESGFIASPVVQDAVERCIARISEAAVKIGSMAEGLVPEIPWTDIRAFGNRLRHAYDGIDPHYIWLIVMDDLPPLKVACETALGKLGHGREP